MAKKNFFYNTAEIKAMKELIRTGEPLKRISRREYVNFNTSQNAFYHKLLKIAKNTTKIREWDGWKTKGRKAQKQEQKPAIIEKQLPEGFTFDGVPKKVTFCVDHFRVYF